MNNKNTNSSIGQFELIIKDLINSNNTNNLLNTASKVPDLINSIPNNLEKMSCEYTKYQNNKIEELKNSINIISNKVVSGDYNNKLMNNYIK